MSRARDRLSAIAVRNASKPGFYHDGGGLYLQVSRFGTKSWILRYTIDKKTRDMGLGPLADWTLAEARERAKKYRQLIDDKRDPIEQRQAEQKAQSDERENRKTFEQCATACHDDKLTLWKNEKHKAQWISTLTSYAFPIQRAIRITPVQRVEMFQPENFKSRSQDLQEAWHDAGQFYWGQAQAWLAGKLMFSQGAAPVPLPRHRVQDIDTPEDWERAEWMFQAMQHAKMTGTPIVNA